jgi:hypothetical protein
MSRNHIKRSKLQNQLMELENETTVEERIMLFQMM